MVNDRIQRGAFSLFELLVVVTIISLLAALLLPAIKMVREQAMSTRCLSNLRQIAIGQMNYANDNDGFSVPTNLDQNQVVSNIGWRDLVYPYLEAQNLGNTQLQKKGGGVTQDCPTWRGNQARLFGYGGWGNGFTINPNPGTNRSLVSGGSDDGRTNGWASDPILNQSYAFYLLSAIRFSDYRIAFADADDWNLEPNPCRYLSHVPVFWQKTGGMRHWGGNNWVSFSGRAVHRYTAELANWDGDRLKPGGGGFIANSVMWTAFVDPGKAKD